MLFILCLPLQNHCIHRLASLGERPLREHGRLLAPCGHNWTSECRSLSTTHVESVSRAHCLIYLPSTAIPQITLKMASTTTTLPCPLLDLSTKHSNSANYPKNGKHHDYSPVPT